MYDEQKRKWFFRLQKKDYRQWTPEEFWECLNYYDDMIAQAHKKGRKEWTEGKKDLLKKMEQLGIERYLEGEMSTNSGDNEKEQDRGTQKDKNKIMYIEYKGDSLAGPGRIGRVQFSKTGKTIYYNNRKLQSLKGGYKANYFDVETGEEFWISGCKQKADDTLYPGTIEIEEDVREEYWREIRKLPQNAHLTNIRTKGKYSKRQPK